VVFLFARWNSIQRLPAVALMAYRDRASMVRAQVDGLTIRRGSSPSMKPEAISVVDGVHPGDAGLVRDDEEFVAAIPEVREEIRIPSRKWKSDLLHVTRSSLTTLSRSTTTA
jgi:hypothetical protein